MGWQRWAVKSEDEGGGKEMAAATENVRAEATRRRERRGMRLRFAMAAIGGSNGSGSVMMLFCGLDLWTKWEKQKKNDCANYGW